MESASLMLALALLLIVVAFVSRPLFHATPVESRADIEVEFLRNSRAMVLSALADLDFEYSTGKIDQSDYESERSQLVADGASVLKQLHQAGLDAPATPNNMDMLIEESTIGSSNQDQL